MQTITISEDLAGFRSDKAIAHLTQLPRSLIKESFENGKVTCNGQLISARHKVLLGDVLTFDKFDEIATKNSHLSKSPDVPLNILFEDEDIIVINKPAGITVHTAPGIKETTLVDLVLEHCNLSHIGDKERPGVVHRLDKETSGVIILAKSNRALKQLMRDFADREVEKEYICIVHGIPTLSTGKIEIPIARHNYDKTKMIACPSGKPAKTTWIVLESFKSFSLMSVKIHTGRTHQIRVHMNYAGFPVAGDTVYYNHALAMSSGMQFPRVMLHAKRLTITHPATQEIRTFETPLPQDFQESIHQLKNC